MNKLISKNPVLRFKEGRKIIKAKWGDAAPNPLSLHDEKGNPYVGMWYTKEAKPVGTALIYNNELVRLEDLKDPFYNSAYFYRTPYYKISFNNQYETPPRDFTNSYKKTGGRPTIDKEALPKGNSSKIKKPTNNIFIKGFQNRRGEIKDVKAMLNLLMKLGLLKDRFGADGKWGKNTEAAYLKYLLYLNNPSGISTPKTPTIEREVSPYELMSNNLENIPLYLRIIFKQGGQLISKNPVERFKLGKKIVKTLQGKNLPTAPKAEKRFRKNSYNTTKEGNRETTTITSQTFGYNRNWPYFRLPATILRIIEGGDTAFVETPEHHIFTKVLPRTALKSGNVYVEYNPKYDKNYSLGGQANTVFNYSITPLEYEILKRRFNTAWNLAK